MDMETLIKRCRGALSVGVPLADVLDALVESGVDPVDAFLAAKAAEILLGDEAS